MWGHEENILLPEEVPLPISQVREIAGGCWHSTLLTGESLRTFETHRCESVRGTASITVIKASSG